MPDLYPGPITDDEEDYPPLRPGGAMSNLDAMSGVVPVNTGASIPGPRSVGTGLPSVPQVAAPDMPTALGYPPVSLPSAPTGPNRNEDALSGALAPPVSTDYKPKSPSMLRRIGLGMVAFKSPQLAEEMAQDPARQAQQRYANDVGEYNTAFSQGLQGQAGKLAQQKQASETNLQGATAEREKASAEAIRNPQPKEGLTPEETTIHDLMTGQNGQPRIDPQTQKPYTYLGAYSAVNQAKQDVKPETEKAPNEYADWKKEHPNGTVEEWNASKRPPKDTTAADNARSDKSYQYNQGALDKVRAPIDALSQRFSRLTDTLNQKTPQADALIAPELMTVMAGGQGSGVRINEAEISRVVGGRTNLESLKAALNKWQTDPSKGLSITDAQRGQIRNLISTVGSKIQAKQKIIDGAQDGLLDSDDPKEHRKVIADTRKKLDEIDAGGGTQADKTYTDAEVQAAAKVHNMKPADIEKAYKDKGYKKANQ